MKQLIELDAQKNSPFETEPQLLDIWHWHEGDCSTHKRDDCLEVNFVLSGNGTQIIADELYSVQDGDILVYNAGVNHNESLMHFAQVDMLCLAVKNLKLPGRPVNELIPKNFSPQIPCQSVASELTQLYQLVQQTDDRTIADETTRKILHIVYKFISSIADDMSSENFSAVEYIRKYIEAHCDDDFVLDDIYEKIHYDEYYIGRLFKKMVGCSPKRYVFRRRISNAQSLLISTSLLLTEISSRVGYADPNYFGKKFKKVIGMSPRFYREKWRETFGESVAFD